MKDVRLKELTLSNWKGQSRKVSFGDNENKVSGANSSGKTSLMRAWNWLLTGYSDCNSPMNADLFNNKEEVTKDTPIASVKAVVSIDNEIYTIERSAEAKFQRKRGTESWEKASSDSYVYKVDEIERSANDFRDWLSEKFTDVDMLKFAVDGSYFVSSIFEDKKKSRQIIERIVGSVTREEMSGDYSVIDDLLKRYDLNEIDQRAANMAKAINDRLNEIPALIRNKESEIADIEQTDFVATDREISELEAERDRLDKQMTDLTERIKPQMEAKHEAERTYQMKKDVLEKAYEDWKKSFDVRRQKLTDEIAAIRQQNARSEKARSDEEARRKMLAQDIERDKKSLGLAKLKRERLLADRDEEKAKTLDPSATICPHCGAELQGEKLQAVIDNFERVKRERIDAIVNEGKRTASEIEALENRIADMQKQLDKPLPQVITQPTEELEKQVFEIINTNTSKIQFLETEQGKALLDDIGSVVIPVVTMPETEDIEAAKRNVNDRLVPLYERRGLKNRLTTLRNALDELRIEQKEKGSELATYEQQRQAVKDYKQEQMEILSRKVNDGLKFSRLEVWSKQKDGTVVPDLVLKDANGVNFSTTNGASRIITTCDIQRFFCEKLGVSMPCFIDEASIIQKENLPNYEDVQTFLLFCADTGLKIESK
jgi:DNA repair exonuclease SbcCD ATPase subunit